MEQKPEGTKILRMQRCQHTGKTQVSIQTHTLELRSRIPECLAINRPSPQCGGLCRVERPQIQPRPVQAACRPTNAVSGGVSAVESLRACLFRLPLFVSVRLCLPSNSASLKRLLPVRSPVLFRSATFTLLKADLAAPSWCGEQTETWCMAHAHAGLGPSCHP